MANSYFSLVDNPIAKNILEASSMNYWGSSSTLDPDKVGGFIRVKPLKREAIIVTLIRMGQNLLIFLCRHSLGLCRGLLCLSSDSLGDLKKSCPYILTRQMRRIG